MQEIINVLIEQLKKVNAENEKLKFRLSNVMLSLPDDNEINQVACDEMHQDWNDLKYQEIYRQAFVDGATWLRKKVKTGNGA